MRYVAIPKVAASARISTGLLLAIGVVASTWLLPSAALALVLLGIVMLGAWEWARLTGLAKPAPRLLYVGVIAVFALTVWQLSVSRQPLAPVVLGVLWWIIALGILAVYQPHKSRSAYKIYGLQIAGVLALVPAWIAMVNLRQLDPRPAWLLFLLLLVWMADSAAFFTGRRFGRTQLAPLISPAKTREGVLGALAANCIVAIFGAWWFELPPMLWVYFIGLCLVTTLLSVAGDLFESLLKRDAGVKDSGTLLPGHGGVLDRIDSTVAAAPPFVLGLYWMHWPMTL
jgi:phosphatidate cytidylyltransferase